MEEFPLLNNVLLDIRFKGAAEKLRSTNDRILENETISRKGPVQFPGKGIRLADPVRRESLDLADLCRQSLPALQAALPGNATLIAEIPTPGPSMCGNADQMRQILTNLTTNAWEALGEKRGTIRISVGSCPASGIPTQRRPPLDWKPRNPTYVCLEVSDDGCGIPDKDFEKLFDPFFSSKLTGRGMGLSAVKGIVTAHEGVVTVETGLGRGSRFRVFLPLVAEAVVLPPTEPTSAATVEGTGNILLVDDDDLVRDMAEDMLRKLGYSVIRAADGLEAVELFQRHRPTIQLILCDLSMPRLNGWETLSAVRKIAPGFPVILTSGYDQAHALAGEHTELPQAFLSKPFKLQDIRHAISKALAKKPANS